MMLAELGELLRSVPAGAEASDYAVAVLEDNALGKATASNRRLSLQRLGELYALDPHVPLFLVLRRLWAIDATGRPLTALLAALARDPMLRASAEHVLAMPVGSELSCVEFTESLRQHVDDRLNDATLDKVRRNVSATWSHAGHLRGRVRKIRQSVEATVGPVAMALWLGSLEGRLGDDLLSSFWMRCLDGSRQRLLDLTLRLRGFGLVNASVGGGVLEIDPSPVFTSAAVGAA